MNNYLIEMLPHMMRNVREYKLLTGVQLPELERLFDEILSIVDDGFVLSASKRGVERWEKMLDIKVAKCNYPIDENERKFMIMTQLNSPMIFTLKKLKEMLTNLCGDDDYEVELEPRDYRLTVRVGLANAHRIGDIETFLEKMTPVNLVLFVSYIFNRYYKLKPFLHYDLSAKTHYKIRNELLCDIDLFMFKKYSGLTLSMHSQLKGIKHFKLRKEVNL